MKKNHANIIGILGLALIITSAVISFSGCTDAEKASFNALGKKHRVTMYSGGKQIGQWESTGSIHNEEHSDGYYFKDDKTEKMISISGDVIIETL